MGLKSRPLITTISFTDLFMQNIGTLAMSVNCEKIEKCAHRTSTSIMSIYGRPVCRLLLANQHVKLIGFLPTEIKLVFGTVCGSNRYFRTNKPMEGRTMGRTNLSKNGFFEALDETLSI